MVNILDKEKTSGVFKFVHTKQFTIISVSFLSIISCRKEKVFVV